MSNPSLTPKTRAIALLLIQAALVLSIAAKYLYERKTCPRVWVRTTQYDPSMPLRGRYLSLQLAVDACGLARVDEHFQPGFDGATHTDYGYWQWQVRPVARNGKLVPLPAGASDRPEVTDEVTVPRNQPCELGRLGRPVDYFLSDVAKTPFRLKPDEHLWVEVTVPPMGPPRPIQLAIAKGGAFTPLNLP